MVPPTPGAELGITSDGFFELDECPRKAVVAGSGYIAVELAGVLRALGSEVVMVLRRDQVLRAFDEMLGAELMAALQADGIEIRTGATLEGIERGERRGTFTVQVSGGGPIDGVDAVLWAIGRAPNVASLELAAAGVETAPNGAIVVDEFQRTGVEGVYAIGDVTGRAPLTPVAIAAGRRLADRLFGGQADRKLGYDCIPTVVFTHPPIGTVGATEAQARTDHGDAVKVYRTRFNSMYHAFSDHPRKTAMKLVTMGEDERVVGCHVIGEGADEMMQGLRGRGTDGRAQTRPRRYGGDPPDERGRARDHALSRIADGAGGAPSAPRRWWPPSPGTWLAGRRRRRTETQS